MRGHSVTLTMPDDLYAAVQRAVEAASEPVETLLLRRIEEAFAAVFSRLVPDERDDLHALGFLSDDALSVIVREQMAQDRQVRMQMLMMRNSQGSITAEEREELARLVDQGQRLALRKAQAANLLMDRGYKVTADDMSALHA